MTRTLIRNGTVVSIDDDIGILSECDVLVNDDKIQAVGPQLEVEDAEVIDAAGTVVAPGFIDTHRHLWQTILRGMLPSCSLGQYFGTVMGRYAPTFGTADIYAGNLVGALEAVNAGITTIVDWCHCNNTPEHTDAAIEALRHSGIRSMYAYGWPGGFEWLMNSTLDHPEDARRVRSEHFPSEDGLLTFALALRGPATLGMEITRRDFELARELDSRITVHAGMRITGHPVRDVQLLADAELLGPDLTLVHCNQTPAEDMRAIAESGGTVSISPYIELVMGHGYPPINRLLDCGLRPTLSVDTTTSSPGDMFSQMRGALGSGRIEALPEDPDTEYEPRLDAMEVLRFATIDGARACGLAERTGSLTPGKQADLIMVRTDQINTVPVVEPVAALVTCSDTSNVDTVMVNGRILKRDGRLVDVDVARVGGLAGEARDRVLAAVEEG